MQGRQDAVSIRWLFSRFRRHDKGDDSHAQGLAEIARQGQNARGDTVVHLFDRPHDGAVVGSAEQGCPQSDEDQEDGSTADGDAREQGEGRQSQGRQDEADRGDAPRTILIRKFINE